LRSSPDPSAQHLIFASEKHDQHGVSDWSADVVDWSKAG
jgi:hypothetical protein